MSLCQGEKKVVMCFKHSIATAFRWGVLRRAMGVGGGGRESFGTLATIKESVSLIKPSCRWVGGELGK